MRTDAHAKRSGIFRMRRSRGGVTGLGLVLLGAWGAIIPFIGPYWDYAYSPNATWTMTSGRLFLQVLPGVVTFFAGLILLGTTNRLIAMAAAWVAVACGGWFVVGPLLAPLWRADFIGKPVGGTLSVSVEQIGMFYGLGATIVLVASFAAGRISVRDTRYIAERASRDERVIEPRVDPGQEISPVDGDRAVPADTDEASDPYPGDAAHGQSTTR